MFKSKHIALVYLIGCLALALADHWGIALALLSISGVCSPSLLRSACCFTSPTYEIVGADNVGFGTEAVESNLGVVVSASDKNSATKRELKDTQGQTYAVVYFDQKNQCEFKAIFDTGATLPVPGATCPVADMTDCLVDTVQTDWSNEQETMISITATYYPGVTLS